MFAVIKKIFLTSLVALIFLTTGAWQNEPVVLAKNQNTNIPEIPLYPGFTWSSLGLSTKDIRISVNGDSIALSGEGYQSLEQYIPSIHQDVLEYYSNEQLAKSGWISYDAFEGTEGVQNVFYHESGVFLSVGFLKCLDVPSNTCVTVWKSEQVDPATITPDKTPEANGAAALSTFGKKNPSDGQTNLNPTNTTLSWEAYSPTPDKYAYCINIGSACANNDSDWTSVYGTNITLTNLSYNTTYYWQVRALTCESCTPKTFVYANNGTVWTFKTKTPTGVIILGNAGVAGAVLSYIDGTAKTVTADATGAYSISLPYNWSGTITPSKSGYIFTPKSASFSNLTAAQTIQNFLAFVAYAISGNTGVAGIPLSYTDGTPKTVSSDGSGNYSILVPSGWSGTVIPSNVCYTFTPADHSYTNVTAPQVGQNFAAAFNPAAGCANVAITIGSNLKGSYLVAPDSSMVKNYASVLDGSVKVVSSTGNNVFASQRAIYGNSFNELMGYPADQFTTEYWFPWYDGVYMNTWVLVGNPSSSQTAYVDIYIGGVKKNITPYTVAPAAQITPKFDGVLAGPVRVVSVTGTGTPTPINIFASERSLYGTSFNEVMGVPFDQFTTEYWFPWYDGVYMNTWVLVGNPSSSQTAYVDIYVNGVKKNDTVGGIPYAIPANGNITPMFTGLVNGPVRVVSVTGTGTPTPINIFASERSTYGGSFNEVMGIPLSQFTTDYWYTWYDNQSMKTWVLVGNPSSSQTAYVDIYIGGVKQGATRTIAPNGNITPMFSLNSGPVRVVSVTGTGTPTPINIFTSERTLYGPSFNEMMGYPANQLTTEYWFTWYDSIYMNTDIYLSKP